MHPIRRFTQIAFSWIPGLGFLTWASVAAAAVGTIASIDGQPEITRASALVPAGIGTPIEVGDQIHAPANARATIVFSDGTVLTLASDARIEIEEIGVGEGQGRRTSINLLAGNLRANVAPIYSEAGGEYRIATHNATAIVRGTEFVVAFNPVSEVTDVVGVEGKVVVVGFQERATRAVVVTPGTQSRVNKNDGPTAPRLLDLAVFRQYIDPFEFVGGGKTESVALASPEGAAGLFAPPPAAAPALVLGRDKLPFRQTVPIKEDPAVVDYGDLDVEF